MYHTIFTTISAAHSRYMTMTGILVSGGIATPHICDIISRAGALASTGSMASMDALPRVHIPTTTARSILMLYSPSAYRISGRLYIAATKNTAWNMPSLPKRFALPNCAYGERDETTVSAMNSISESNVRMQNLFLL